MCFYHIAMQQLHCTQGLQLCVSNSPDAVQLANNSQDVGAYMCNQQAVNVMLVSLQGNSTAVGAVAKGNPCSVLPCHFEIIVRLHRTVSQVCMHSMAGMWSVASCIPCTAHAKAEAAVKKQCLSAKCNQEHEILMCDCSCHGNTAWQSDAWQCYFELSLTGCKGMLT